MLGNDGTDKGLILLVEDDLAASTALAELLRLRGYEVSVAASLAEARLLLARSPPILVISDLELPDGDGWELMRELSRDGLQGIALSGHGTQDDRDRSAAAGFSLHLHKPSSFSAIDAAIDQVLRSGQTTGASVPPFRL